MFTRYKREQRILFLEKKLIFLELPPDIEQIQVKMEEEKYESLLAAVIDDDKYTSGESAEKGEIRKQLDRIAQQIDNNLPKNLQLASAQTNYQKYGGDGGKEKGTAVKSAIREPIDGQKWDLGKQMVELGTMVDLNKVPVPLIEGIKKAKSPSDARIACDTFEAERSTQKELVEGAKRIEEFKKVLLENIKRVAMVALDQKQMTRFETAKKLYIQDKAKNLFPSEAALDIKEVEGKRKLASVYLEGFMSKAALKADKKEIQEEFDSTYGVIDEQMIKEFVESLINNKSGDFWKDDSDYSFYKSATPEVKAYLEGLLDAVGKVDELDEKLYVNNQKREIIMKKYLEIPESQRNDLTSVQNAFGDIQAQINFETAKNTFIETKVKELYPDNSNDKSLEGKRNIARQYLAGLMKATSIQAAGNIQEELNDFYEIYSPDDLRTYIDGEFDENKERGWKTYPEFQELFSSGSPSVRAYLEGLMDSLAFENNDGKPVVRMDDFEWIKKRYNSIIPEEARHNIDIVKGYFENANAVSFTGSEEGHGGMKWAIEVLDNEEKPEVKLFYEQRMAKANQILLGKPGGEEAVIRYKRMLLTEISKQNPGNVDMEKLNALPQPWIFEATTFTVSKLPEGAIAVAELPNAINEYAKKLTAQTGAEKIVFQFRYDHHVYYVNKPPFKVYVVPESKPV